MERPLLVLCALTPGQGAAYSPVQVQKLLFLLDKNIAGYVEGPHFNFEPYHYGPFDRDVYTTFEQLAAEGLVEIEPETLGRWNTYRLTPEGRRKGDQVLATLPEEVQQFIRNASGFVRTVSFAQLVSAIYKAYPEMKVNSVFQG